jgi:hypothetical protein
MSDAKEASEAEHLGNKLLQLCRKKAPEKDLLQILEVGTFFKFFQTCARDLIANARVFLSLSLLGTTVLLKAVATRAKATTRLFVFFCFSASSFADP